MSFKKDRQYYKFCAYGFFKNLRFFDPFLLLFFIDKGLAYTQIGVLYGFRELVINLFEVFSGVIADVIGRKRAMVTSFVLYLISFLMFYGLNGFSGFMLAFLFYGLADAFRTGTHKAMILTYLKNKGWEDDKTKYYGRTRSWSQKGSAISSLISAALVFFTGDYSLIFLLSTLPYIIDLILLSSYPNYLNGDVKVNINDITSLIKQHIIQLFSAVKRLKSIKVIVLASSFTGYYKASRDYLQVLIATAAVAIPLSFQIEDTKKVAVVIGIVYSVIYIITSQASKKAYLIEKYSGEPGSALKKIQLIAWVMGALAGFAYIHNIYSLAIILFGLILVAQNFRRPIEVKYVSSNFDEKIMASVLSVESQSETFFAAVISFALGLMADLFGLGWAIFIVSVMLLVIYTVIRQYWTS